MAALNLVNRQDIITINSSTHLISTALYQIITSFTALFSDHLHRVPS